MYLLDEKDKDIVRNYSIQFKGEDCKSYALGILKYYLTESVILSQITRKNIPLYDDDIEKIESGPEYYGTDFDDTTIITTSIENLKEMYSGYCLPKLATISTTTQRYKRPFTIGFISKHISDEDISKITNDNITDLLYIKQLLKLDCFDNIDLTKLMKLINDTRSFNELCMELKHDPIILEKFLLSQHPDIDSFRQIFKRVTLVELDEPFSITEQEHRNWKIEEMDKFFITKKNIELAKNNDEVFRKLKLTPIYVKKDNIKTKKLIP